MANSRYRYLMAALLLAVAPALAGEPARHLRVLALFPGKAMVELDGEQRLLRTGTPSSRGLRLISADAHGALIEIDGQTRRYQVGSPVGASFVRPAVREARIRRDGQGAYRTTGSINGRMIDLLVDTGATTIALSGVEARRLGIPYRLKGEKTRVRTASGTAAAYSVMLERVRVGAIELRQVEAVVLEGRLPEQVLLGMSFLKRVKMENRDGLLLLSSR